MAITKKKKNILIGLTISLFIGALIFIYYEFFNTVKGSTLTDEEIKKALMNSLKKDMAGEMNYYTANATFEEMKTNSPEWFYKWFASEYLKYQVANPKYMVIPIDTQNQNIGGSPYEKLGASLVSGIIAWQQSSLTWADALKEWQDSPANYKMFINNLGGVKDPLKVLSYMNEKYNLPL